MCVFKCLLICVLCLCVYFFTCLYVFVMFLGDSMCVIGYVLCLCVYVFYLSVSSHVCVYVFLGVCFCVYVC